MNYKIGSYQDKGVKVTMVADSEYSLTHLYTQAVNRLMRGIAPNGDEAIRQLKAAHPELVQQKIDALMKNYTPEGIAAFETSLRKGFKYIGMWNNPAAQ
ncbi:hypothetical protein KAR91_24465 [Candidatus Pacearchaeota archaeon]|nr:hypothetical protein [Candidatus Pacearchaeota archaeon]